MTFSDTQIHKLRRRPGQKHVRTRVNDGREFPYLEGWYAIAEANRIFGYDAWNRETVWFECVWRQQKGTQYAAAYLVRVRIVVRTDRHSVIREGSGAGEAVAATPGQAHELAAKAAETDATKRALSTFGNPFGLSLYAPRDSQKTDRVNSHQPASSRTKPQDRDKTVQSRANGYAVKKVKASGAQIPPTSIDKSLLANGEPKRVRNNAHLKFVATQSCLICGRLPSQAHHLTFTQPRAMGSKVSDEFTVPLCVGHHRELHGYGNERKWWEARKIDPLPAAQVLWLETSGGKKSAGPNESRIGA